MKKAISITLTDDNLLWLKGRALALTRGNVSEMLDGLIRGVRAAGRTDPASVKSVAGTIDLPDDDSLVQADSHVRAMFERSLNRPMLVRETPRRPSRRG